MAFAGSHIVLLLLFFNALWVVHACGGCSLLAHGASFELLTVGMRSSPLALDIRDLLRLFQIFIQVGDVWSLASSSLVCKTWRRLACVVAECYTNLLRSQPMSVAAMTKLTDKVPCHVSRGQSFQVLPAPPPFSSDNYEGAHCNSSLGSLLGRGSFARVYNIGAISPWCIKVASGGLAATDRFTVCDDEHINAVLKEEELHVPSLEFCYYSSGRAAKLLSHTQVSVVLLYEYLRLQEITSFPLPDWEKESLYPRPYTFGVLGNTGYYVMEKLQGVTMRKVLLSTVRHSDKKWADTVTIDFAPLVARLIRYISYLMTHKLCYHGDMKPENIMLVPDRYHFQACLWNHLSYHAALMGAIAYVSSIPSRHLISLHYPFMVSSHYPIIPLHSLTGVRITCPCSCCSTRFVQANDRSIECATFPRICIPFLRRIVAALRKRIWAISWTSSWD